MRGRFSKPEIKEISRNLCKITIKKIISLRKTNKIEKNLLKLEKNLKKYYDYDDIEYKGVRDVGNLFDLSIDEDYYEPIIMSDAFNRNYIEYESKRDEAKFYQLKNILTWSSHI